MAQQFRYLVNLEHLSTYNEDGDLFLQIAAGNEPAFKILFDKYRIRFYAVALKLTRSEVLAEEIVQEIFITVWLNRLQLPAIKKPSTYLFTMVYNNVYSHFKKLALERRIKNEASDKEQWDKDAEEWLDARESRRLIDEAVAQLPPQRQLVYKLSREQGLNREEIAGRLGISPNTVKNHLQEALKSIRAHLGHSAGLFIVVLSVHA